MYICLFPLFPLFTMCCAVEGEHEKRVSNNTHVFYTLTQTCLVCPQVSPQLFHIVVWPPNCWPREVLTVLHRAL